VIQHKAKKYNIKVSATNVTTLGYKPSSVLTIS